MVERSKIKERSPYMTPYVNALDVRASQIYGVGVPHNFLCGFFFFFFLVFDLVFVCLFVVFFYLASTATRVSGLSRFD